MATDRMYALHTPAKFRRNHDVANAGVGALSHFVAKRTVHGLCWNRRTSNWQCAENQNSQYALIANLELTGTARLYRAAYSARRARGRAQG